MKQGPGEKVKIYVYYPMEHVLQFVANSPVEGWRVMLIESEFTNMTMYCETKPNDKHIATYCLMNFGQYTYVKYVKIVNDDN